MCRAGQVLQHHRLFLYPEPTAYVFISFRDPTLLRFPISTILSILFYLTFQLLPLIFDSSHTNPSLPQASDPGILINIYQTLSSYLIPGPSPFVCGGSSSPAPTTSAVATTSKATSTTLATSTKSSSSTAATATGAVAAMYAQCGGTGWTGATVCAAGSTCKASGAYYSK
jgi:hypothetical protein